jgi:hypothetical protein
MPSRRYFWCTPPYNDGNASEQLAKVGTSNLAGQSHQPQSGLAHVFPIKISASGPVPVSHELCGQLVVGALSLAPVSLYLPRSCLSAPILIPRHLTGTSI